MRWQRLAFRSVAALLVTPSTLFASCYLPMGSLDSDYQLQKLPSPDFDSEYGVTGSLSSSAVKPSFDKDTAHQTLGQAELRRAGHSELAQRNGVADSSGGAFARSLTGQETGTAEPNNGKFKSGASLGRGSETGGAFGHLRKWLSSEAGADVHVRTPLLTPAGEPPADQSPGGIWQGHLHPMTASHSGSGNVNKLECGGRANSASLQAQADGKLSGKTDRSGAAKSAFSEEAKIVDQYGNTKEGRQVGVDIGKGMSLEQGPALKLNILILVIGTRGDVQPMAALGRALKDKYGHRVRVATHTPFKDFVEGQGLEFYPMPGNPNFLIDQMVSTSASARWSLPSSPLGILNVRKWFKGIIFSHWPACTAPPPHTAPVAAGSVKAVQQLTVVEAPRWSTHVAEAEAPASAYSTEAPHKRASSEVPPDRQITGRPTGQAGNTASAGNEPRNGSLKTFATAAPAQDPKSAQPIPSLAESLPVATAVPGGHPSAVHSNKQIASDVAALGGMSEGFSPDLIVASPTTQVALSCAQRLGVPLHIFYLMPYTRTQYLPHPLSGASLPGPDGSKSTRFTWSVIELVAASGVWDYVNRFRKQVLGLPLLPLGTLSEFFLLHKLAVPTTYAFSPDLVPKPRDWGEHIRIVNYAYDDSLASRYQVSPLLQRFLEAGPPPVYIGFGSMKLDDPDALMDTLITAVKAAGVRAVIHKRGWADDVDELQNRLASFGANRRPARKSSSWTMDAYRNRSASLDSEDGGRLRERRASGSFVSDDILIYEEDVPHGWLFDRCQAVVTHGGAGTVGAALRAGKPVMVVPFWGDQFLWGQLVAAAGVGPPAVPVRKLTEAPAADDCTVRICPRTSSHLPLGGSDGSRQRGSDFCEGPRMQQLQLFSSNLPFSSDDAPPGESLAAGLEEMTREDMVRAAAVLGDKITSSENGVLTAAEHIQTSLPLEALRCDGCRARPARVWACHKLQKLCPHCVKDLAHDPLKPLELLPYRPVEWRFTCPRGDACGLCPETVFTPDQMREADWRSSTAVRRVVGTFYWPQSERPDSGQERS